MKTVDMIVKIDLTSKKVKIQSALTWGDFLFYSLLIEKIVMI